jgi:DNA repair protein RadC
MAPTSRKSVKNWPTEMRPRERTLEFGIHSLNNAELLALFVRTGNRNRNVIELSSDILQHFGGFQNLLSCSLGDFQKISGLGLSKWTQIQAAQEIVKRASLEQLKDKPIIKSQAMTRRFLQSSIGFLDHEVFACFFLDHFGYLLEFKILFRGDAQQTFIYPREIIKEALKRNAHAIIMAHNHPNGIAQPSDADLHLTKTLHNTLKSIEIKLLDHFIVTQNGFYSFRDAGYMDTHENINLP